MSKRINDLPPPRTRLKLSANDIYWSEEYHHLTILCELKDYEILKQQILEDHEITNVLGRDISNVQKYIPFKVFRGK